MGRGLGPAGRIGRGGAGDGAVDGAQLQALGDLAESHGDRRAADAFHELGHHAVENADLHALEACQVLDRLGAEDDLRAERPYAQELEVELLLQAQVHVALVGRNHLLGGLVVGIEPDHVQAQDHRLIARHLAHAQAHHVVDAGLHHPQLFEFLHAGGIQRLVVDIQGQAGLGGQFGEERQFLVLLDEAGGKRHAHDAQLDLFLCGDGLCGGEHRQQGGGAGGQTGNATELHGTSPCCRIACYGYSIAVIRLQAGSSGRRQVRIGGDLTSICTQSSSASL